MQNERKDTKSSKLSSRNSLVHGHELEIYGIVRIWIEASNCRHGQHKIHLTQHLI